jgi:phosphosulfolactate synthase (CoM biosynthesis protein A)
MDQATLKKVMSELGKKGGPARAKALTAKERKAIATKASAAAAKARSKKARQARKAQTGKKAKQRRREKNNVSEALFLIPV